MEVLLVLVALAISLIGMRERPFHSRTGYRWFVLQGAAIWVGMEMIRGSIPSVGTWGFAAYALYNQPWMIQPVSVFGIYGLSMVIMLVNYALAQLVLAFLDQHGIFSISGKGVDWPGAKRWLVGAAAVLVGWSVLGLAMYRMPQPELRVAAVQPGAYLARDSDEEAVGRGLALVARLSQQAADEGARLIVWPETFFPFDPQETERDFFASLAMDTGAYFVLGYGVHTEEGLRNEVALLSPAGTFLGVSGKARPVVFAGETSITRGTYPTYATPIGVLGNMICFDLDFTDTARQIARGGAQIISVPSFDWAAIAHRHYSHVVLRAVENRVSMIKADVAWSSAIIDPYGNILSRQVSVEPTQAVLVADIPLGDPRTIQLVLGDWIGWLSLMGMVWFFGLDVYTSSRVYSNRKQVKSEEGRSHEP